MKNNILFAIILVISLQVVAQSPADSLYGIWNDKTRHDTVRLNALNELAYGALMIIGPDSLKGLADEMLDLASKIGSKRYQVDATIQQSRCFLFFEKDQEGLKAAERAAMVAGEINYVYGEARALALMSVAYGRMGNSVMNIQCKNKMYETVESQDANLDQPVFGEIKAYPLKPLIDNYHNDVGLVYSNAGAFSEALDHFNLALKSSLVTGTPEQIASVTNNIAIVYKGMEEYDLAIKYYEEARDLFEEIGHKVFLANTIGNLGVVYTNIASYEKAEEYLMRHLEMRKELVDPFNLAGGYINLADLEIRRKDFEKALEYTNLAEGIFLEAGLNYGMLSVEERMMIVNMIQGNAHMELGNYNKAIELFKESYQLADKYDNMEYKAGAAEYLYTVYKKGGNLRSSLNYHEELMVLKDSMKTDDVGKKLLQMDYSKKKLTDSLLQVEEKNRLELAYEKELLEETNTRNIFVASGLILLIISGGLWNRLNFTRKSRKIIEKERDRSDSLLLNILPAEVAEELKEKGEAQARDFELVTVLFTDFKGFTQASEKMTANELVDELNYCFKGFDRIIEKYGIEKIKTIGDAYMAVAGLHGPAADAAVNAARAGLEMQEFVVARKKARESEGHQAFDMRVGLHSGHVVAGIVGIKKFQYDIWGDTVNTAARMESAGQVGKVNISQTTFELVADTDGFSFTDRGKIEAKGKGEMNMYFIST
ncbi:MAG: adenylate/guanylate cyclase domain-containing protein [Robiginitalea sp.]